MAASSRIGGRLDSGRTAISEDKTLHGFPRPSRGAVSVVCRCGWGLPGVAVLVWVLFWRVVVVVVVAVVSHRPHGCCCIWINHIACCQGFGSGFGTTNQEVSQTLSFWELTYRLPKHF